jgi:hypothetical protein
MARVGIQVLPGGLGSPASRCPFGRPTPHRRRARSRKAGFAATPKVRVSSRAALPVTVS